MDERLTFAVLPNIHRQNETIRESQFALWNTGYLVTARNMPRRRKRAPPARTRYFYLPITFSAASALLFLSAVFPYCLLSARVSPILVTFLKLITSAPSTSLPLFLFRRCGPSVRPRPDVTVSPFPGCCSVSSARPDKWPPRPCLPLVVSSSPP